MDIVSSRMTGRERRLGPELVVLTGTRLLPPCGAPHFSFPPHFATTTQAL
jgi:hypothetical protein